MAQDATVDLKAELGPEMADLNLNDLRDLHPRRMVQKYLFEDIDDELAAWSTRSATPVAERAALVHEPVAAAPAQPAAPVASGLALGYGDPAPYDTDAT